MGMNKKCVINNTIPWFWFQVEAFKCYVFKVLYKIVGNNREKGGTHGCALGLLIANSIKSEEGGAEEKIDKAKGFRVNNFRYNVNGFQDRDFGK